VRSETHGILSAHFAKGKKAFSFEYDKTWLKSKNPQVMDPDIQFCTGAQYSNDKENFGVFLDSMPIMTTGRGIYMLSQELKDQR